MEVRAQCITTEIKTGICSKHSALQFGNQELLALFCMKHHTGRNITTASFGFLHGSTMSQINVCLGWEDKLWNSLYKNTQTLILPTEAQLAFHI